MFDNKDLKIQIQRGMIADLTDEVLKLRADLIEAQRVVEPEPLPTVPLMNAEGVALKQRQAFRRGFLTAREYYGGDLSEDDFDEDEDGGRTFHGAECIRADNPGLICTCNDEEAETTATDLAVNEYPGRD